MAIVELDRKPSETSEGDRLLHAIGEQRIPGVGLGRAAARGAARGVEQSAGLADLILNAVLSQVPAEVGQTNLQGGARALSTRLLGPTVPRSRLRPEERVMESAVAGGVSALPTAFLGGPTTANIVRRALFEIGSGVTGQVSADIAEDVGAGALVQLGAGIVGGSLPAIGRGLVNRLSPTAKAAQSGRVVRETFQTVVGEEQIPEARRVLAAEAGKVGQAPTASVLEDVAPRVKDLERSLLASGSEAATELSTKIVRLRKLNEEAIQEALSGRFAAGRLGPAHTAFRQAQEELAQRTKNAYLAAGDLDGIPTNGLIARSRQIVSEALEDGLGEELPREMIRKVEKFNFVPTNLKRLRGLRSQLGEKIRLAQRAGKDNRARYLTQLRVAVDDTLETVARETGAEEVGALRRAISVARDEFRLVGKEGRGAFGSTRLFTEVDDLQKGFKRFILGASRPSEEIGRLRLLIGDDPDAWLGIQGLARDAIFGEDLSRLGTKNGATLLRRNRDAFDAIYGAGAADNALAFNDRVRQLRSGVTGTRFEVVPPGSGVTDFSRFETNAGILANIARGDWGGAFGNALATLFRSQRDRALRRSESLKLLAGALADSQIAQAFLEPLGPEAFTRWQRRAEKYLIGARSAAAATTSAETGANP